MMHYYASVLGGRVPVLFIWTSSKHGTDAEAMKQKGKVLHCMKLGHPCGERKVLSRYDNFILIGEGVTIDGQETIKT